jgi:DNA-binding LacI/PurR family transcriptional regulator
MAATIVDVAARAGVSTATVSRVLSGAAPARPATRERVLAAARELAYRPSGVARALKGRRTRTIGLLITDIENPFYPQIVRAAEDEAHARGLGLLLCNTAEDPERELAYLDLLLDRRIDGLIVASGRTIRRHARRLAGIGLPVVGVNAAAHSAALAGVTTGQRRGARLAAEHVLALGHRRVGHITAPDDQAAAARLRRAGVADAIRAAGLESGSLLIAEGDERIGGGIRAAAELLAARPAPTAIVCYNDLTAIGAMRAVRQARLRIPEDVSIVGFDDIELAAWTDPGLTTVRQPTDEMARWAVARLADVLDGREPGGHRHATLAPSLVVRASTAPPVQGAT